MRSIAAVLSACLLNCAYALPAPAAENPLFVLKEIKFDGSADWSRVVGGSPASNGQFPYMVSLRRSDSHLCGAAIVSSVYLLSAAHCTIGASPKSITAIVGTVTLNSGGTGYVLDKAIYHPDYNYPRDENDIIVLRTANPITGSSVVASIPIGSSQVGVGVEVTLTGWGQTSSYGATPNHLQFINLRTIDNDECAESHWYQVYESNLCTLTQAGEGTCYGDSGGPLVASGVLVGIVSWGEPCALGYPDVFTRISSFVPWIQENAT